MLHIQKAEKCQHKVRCQHEALCFPHIGELRSRKSVNIMRDGIIRGDELYNNLDFFMLSRFGFFTILFERQVHSSAGTQV